MEKEFPNNLVGAVAEQFRLAHKSQSEQVAKAIEDMESTESREKLAKDNPALARALEGSTREDRDARGAELALSLAVGFAVVWGKWNLDDLARQTDPFR